MNEQVKDYIENIQAIMLVNLSRDLFHLKTLTLKHRR